jgi:hypothetical protein
MVIGELIEKVAAGWQVYHTRGTVDQKDPMYDLVMRQFPQALEPHIAAYDSLYAEGSTGRGNITVAPWIRVFDQRFSPRATTGYYIVYLFSTNMTTVTLSLAFGTKQFEKQFGRPAAAFPAMRSAAIRLQEMFSHLIPAHMLRDPIDLAAAPRQELHYSYQQSSILSYPPYRVGALPEEAKLVADLQELSRLYTEIVSDPLEATVERLVEAVVQPAPQVKPPEVSDFEPRVPLRNPEHNGRSIPRNRGRYSPESRKVGDAGEKLVLRYEQERLRKLGRHDFADQVRWHTREQEFPGWDITSFDDEGKELFIEVKSS